MSVATTAKQAKPCERCGVRVTIGGRNFRQPVVLCRDCREVDPAWPRR